jgi:hypothetical protein
MTQELLAEIKAAYASLGMRPIRDHYYVHDAEADYGCPMTVLAIHRGVVDRSNPKYLEKNAASIHEWACKEFSDFWVQGFLSGYHRGEYKVTPRPSLYCDGYDFGLLVAQEILPHGRTF